MRIFVQPYAMRFNTASTQSLSISRNGNNTFQGTSAATMIIRLRINAVVNGQNFFDIGSDGTQSAMVIKNQNNTTPTLRINFRAGGTAVNYDIDGTVFSYVLGKIYTIALRYTGALLQTYVDGVLIDSRAATGAIGTLTQNWRVGAAGSGAGPATIDVFFVKAWKLALSDVELQRATFSKFSSGSVIYLNFSEGSGTPVERAQNGTVTLSNSPTWLSVGRSVV